MPQLDFTTYASQIFWLFVTFGLLYWLVVKKVLPSVGGTIEHRRARIADDLDEARRLREASEKALAAYEDTMKGAREKAHGIVSEHKAKITAELEAERTRIEAELAAKIAEAEAKTREAKEKALKELDGVIGELAGEIVARVTGDKVSETDLKKAVEKVLG